MGIGQTKERPASERKDCEQYGWRCGQGIQWQNVWQTPGHVKGLEPGAKQAADEFAAGVGTNQFRSCMMSSVPVRMIKPGRLTSLSETEAGLGSDKLSLVMNVSLGSLALLDKCSFTQHEFPILKDHKYYHHYQRNWLMCI